MPAIRFAPWWKPRSVELVTEDGEAWLVGKGPWPREDIWDCLAWIPNEWELTRGFTTRPGPRVSVAPYLAFASIRTAEQAVAFAAQFGLLGLRRVDSPELLEFPDDPEVWERWKRGKGLLTYRIRWLRGPQGEEFELQQAAQALRLTWDEFKEAFTFLRHTPGAPLFYPEPLDEWLREADWLRQFLQGVGLGGFLGHAFARGELSVEGTQGFTQAGEPVIQYETLRDALFLQAALTKASRAGAPRECEAPGCSRWFLPVYENARYCSPECKRRAQNRRAYQRRKG